MFKKKYSIKFILFYIVTLVVSTFTANAQLVVTPTGTAASLAAKLSGPGITIVSSVLTCAATGNGTFVTGPIATPIGIDSGIILSTGLASQTSGTEPSLTNTQFLTAGDPDLTPLLGSTAVSKDACSLVITFVPKGDTVSFRYQFGSEEYRQSNCGTYNDAFAFFISGPGVSATLPGVNMALVPGTTIPVTVNTINSGIPGPGLSIATCNAMGAGSPFTSYYINNAGGTQTTYRGYTTVLTAKHYVNPCDTYRIKMAITDAGNAQYDSGVFIEAGSLKTNTYHFDLTDSIGATIFGVPHSIVKGCGTDTVTIKSAYAVPFATTLNLAYSGTAIQGTDYATMPTTVTIPSGDTIVKIPVTALVTATLGTKAINISLTAPSICGLIDSITLTVLDHPAASVLSHDTTICAGTPLQLFATGTTGLAYNWTPATYLDNPALINPTATPTTTTTYTMNATLPGSHCAVISDAVTITTFTPIVSILTPDTTICEGEGFTIRVSGSASYIYSWSPSIGLNSPAYKEPVAAPTTSTTYILTTTVPGLGCPVTNQINVTVISTDFTIQTIDTFLCDGSTINLNALVTPVTGVYTYLWTGPNGYTSFLLNPVITTATTLNEGLYNLTVTNAGGCSKYAHEHITVYPVPRNIIQAAPIEICQYSPELPLLVPRYNNLMWYSSSADTTPSVFAPYPRTDSIGTYIYYASQISFISNCIGPKEEITVKVENCCNGTISVPTAFTPNGDGHNDVLRVIKSSEYAVTDFSIYNRWGELVFQATSDKPSWDGTYMGQPADMGQYYYYLVVNCVNSDKTPIVKKGDVTLIR